MVSAGGSWREPFSKVFTLSVCFLLTYNEGIQAEDISASLDSIQKELNYTRDDGTINCDESKCPLPTCVDGRLNRQRETTPFTGEGACDDVIRTMTLTSDEATSTMDEECSDEAFGHLKESTGSFN
jgi:hypothetical protein